MSADAVEIRMLWGETPLWIRHLAPPRSFLLDGAPLVLVDGSGVRVAVPAGATPAIDGDPLAAPAPDSVPLDPGRRVMITLPSPHPSSPYRTAPDGAGAHLGIEIALVPAVPAVARARPLGGAGRFPAVTAAVALVVAGLLGEASRPVLPVDEDEALQEQGYRMLPYLQAVAERELEAEEERRAAEPPPEEPRWQVWAWNEPLALMYPWWPEPSDGLEELPLEAMAGLALTPPSLVCDDGGSALEGRRAGFLTAHDAICAGRLSPHEAQSVGTAPWLGRGRSDRPSVLWFDQLAAARRALHPRGHGAPPRPRVGLERLPGGAPSADVDGAVRARLRDVRACYALGLAEEPGLAGRIDLRFTVGSDGAATHAIPQGTGLADLRVVHCALRALDGMWLGLPPHARGGFTYRLTLQPGAR